MSLWARAGDRVRVDTFATVAAQTVVVVLLRAASGEITPLRMTVTSAGAAGTVDVDQVLSDGSVARDSEVVGFHAQTVSSSAVKRGQLYVQAWIGPIADTANTSFSSLLGCGYIYDGHVLGSQEYVEPGPGGGDGNIRTIQIADPVAGNELSVTVPTSALWRVHSFTTIVLGGAAAFTPTLQWTDGTNVKFVSQPVTVTGAATDRITWGQGLTYQDGTVDSTRETVPIIQNNLLPEGYVVSTSGITADDNYEFGELVVEEWLVP